MHSLVNDRSIMNIKRRALRRSKTLARDPETNEVVLPSRLSVWMQKIRAPFGREFWEDKLEKNDNETLVDNKVLSYAYLEAGIIETVGS